MFSPIQTSSTMYSRLSSSVVPRFRASLFYYQGSSLLFKRKFSQTKKEVTAEDLYDEGEQWYQKFLESGFHNKEILDTFSKREIIPNNTPQTPTRDSPKNEYCINYWMNHYASSGEVEETIKWLDEVLEQAPQNVTPFTWNILLQGFVDSNKFDEAKEVIKNKMARAKTDEVTDMLIQEVNAGPSGKDILEEYKFKTE